MNITIPKKLKILSYYLPDLYIVGGYVRNSLLGLPVSDVDIAAAYSVDEVVNALANSEFGVVSINKRLGTVKIFSREDKDFSAEYTTFRIDSYPVGSGVHTPADVVFTKDMSRDATRRDFTVNAIYYGIDKANFVDYTGGMRDIDNRVLRTTVAPDKVFSEDGLRILRLIRLAAELNFDVEEKTRATAKRMAYLLKDISGERKREEFMKILVADTRYPSKATADAHLRGVRLMDELGVLQYVLPDLVEGKGMLQKPEYHVYDVFEHSIQTMYHCPPDIRLAGLLHDVGKPASVRKNGNMFLHGDEGQKIARRLLGKNGLKCSNKEIDDVTALIGAHMYDIDGLASERKVKMFIVENKEYIDKIVALKRADAMASAGDKNARSVSADKIERLYEAMKKDGTPMSVADLAVSGNDLLDTKIPVDKRSWAMHKMLEHAVAHADCRTREAQLQYLRGLNYGNN